MEREMARRKALVDQTLADLYRRRHQLMQEVMQIDRDVKSLIDWPLFSMDTHLEETVFGPHHRPKQPRTY